MTPVGLAVVGLAVPDLAGLTAPPSQPADPFGFNVWGVFVGFGIYIIAYVVWMVWAERKERRTGGGAVPSGPARGGTAGTGATGKESAGDATTRR